MSVKLPQGFAALLRHQFPDEVAEAALNGYDLPSKTAIRSNPAKPARLTFAGSPVAWCKEGLALDERPIFTLDPLWHAGAYYVQEAGSMAVGATVAALLPDKAKLVLDLCAAPGGKSTHLRSVLPSDCLLVSNEIIRSRVARLKENLERWGHPAHAITSLDPAQIGEGCPAFFDAVIVDAPCSGEGLFRKDPSAAEEWTEEHVAFCASRQRRILADIWPALRPGGLLVYSTCTLNTQEDEDVSSFIIHELGAQMLELPTDVAASGFPSASYPMASRFVPDAHGTEGQFVAAFCKSGEAFNSLPSLTRKDMLRLPEVKSIDLNICRSVLPDVQADDLFVFKDEIRLIPKQVRQAALQVLRSVSIVSLGIAIAEPGMKTVQPLQGLATFSGYEILAQRVELTLSQALAYLRRDDLRDLLKIPPGLYLATYQHIGLGWVKVIQGGRVNNLLPQARRIRMDLPLAALEAPVVEE